MSATRKTKPASRLPARPTLNLFRGDDQQIDTPQEPSADWTLPEFYRQYAAPGPLAKCDLSEARWYDYSRAVSLWGQALGPVQLKKITSRHCEDFREAVAAMPNGRGAQQIAADTTKKHCGCIARLLDLAADYEEAPLFGWRDLELPDGSHRFEQRPRPKMPAPGRVEKKSPRAITAEELDRLLAIADSPGHGLPPCGVAGVPTGCWWYWLLVFEAETGLRIGEAVQCTWPMVSGRVLVTPPEIRKGRSQGVTQLSLSALEAAARIERRLAPSVRAAGDERLFPWPLTPTPAAGMRRLQRHRSQLWQAAGIPAEAKGFHGLRKHRGTEAFRAGFEAAREALGHSTAAVTKAHYVDLSMGLA